MEALTLFIIFGIPSSVLALSLARDSPSLALVSYRCRSNRKVSHHGYHPRFSLGATTEDNALFWPASSLIAESVHSDAFNDDSLDEDEKLLTSTLDSVVKVYATHSEPDFLIPWQKKHQTTSTSSGFVLDVPGIGYRVMTNAHSVEYGSVVQVQRRGDDEKHAAVVEAVGNECDLALLRVDSLFAPTDESGRKPYALPLGPLPPLQDEVEVLGYPAGGDSLCVTKGVVSRIEMQEYAQAGARLLSMQIDAAINPGTISNQKYLDRPAR
jgi:S1-C subfamily serine protease